MGNGLLYISCLIIIDLIDIGALLPFFFASHSLGLLLSSSFCGLSSCFLSMGSISASCVNVVLMRLGGSDGCCREAVRFIQLRSGTLKHMVKDSETQTAVRSTKVTSGFSIQEYI